MLKIVYEDEWYLLVAKQPFYQNFDREKNVRSTLMNVGFLWQKWYALWIVSNRLKINEKNSSATKQVSVFRCFISTLLIEFKLQVKIVLLFYYSI